MAAADADTQAWEEAVCAAQTQLCRGTREALARGGAGLPADAAAVAWDTLFHARVVRLRTQQRDSSSSSNGRDGAAPALVHVAAAGTALFAGLARLTVTTFFRQPDLLHALWDSLGIASEAVMPTTATTTAAATAEGEEDQEEAVCSFGAWCLLRAGDLQRYCARVHAARQCCAAARRLCPADGAVYNQLALADAAAPCVWALHHYALAAAAVRPVPRSHGNLVVVLRRHAARRARTRARARARARTRLPDALADALAAVLLSPPTTAAAAAAAVPAAAGTADTVPEALSLAAATTRSSGTVADAARLATALVALVLYAERCTRAGPRHGAALALLAGAVGALVRCDGAELPGPHSAAWAGAVVALHVLLMWCAGAEGAGLAACAAPKRTAMWAEAALVLNALAACGGDAHEPLRAPRRLLHEEAALLAFAPVAEHMAAVQRLCGCDSGDAPRLPLLLRTQTLRDPAAAFRVRTAAVLQLARRLAGAHAPGVDLHYDAAHGLFTTAPRTCVLVAQPCLRRPRIVTAAAAAAAAPPLQQPRHEEEHEPPASLPSAQPLTLDIPLLEEGSDGDDE